jgi:hypothetical protein
MVADKHRIQFLSIYILLFNATLPYQKEQLST